MGQKLYFGYQLSVSFTPLRIPFEEGKLYYGIVLLINEVFILTLGVVDYYQTGKFSNFQIITVIILLYAVLREKGFKEA